MKITHYYGNFCFQNVHFFDLLLFDNTSSIRYYTRHQRTTTVLNTFLIISLKKFVELPIFLHSIRLLKFHLRSDYLEPRCLR